MEALKDHHQVMAITRPQSFCLAGMVYDLCILRLVAFDRTQALGSA